MEEAHAKLASTIKVQKKMKIWARNPWLIEGCVNRYIEMYQRDLAELGKAGQVASGALDRLDKY